MRWQRQAIYTVLFVAWGIFAVWQYRAYLHETELIQETLHQQAHAVMNALIGGIQSHRRLGKYFEQQLQNVLDGLLKSENVLAAAVLAEDGGVLVRAGEVELLRRSAPIAPGDILTAEGFRLIETVEILPDVSSQTLGGGRGRGGGMGFGRLSATSESEGPFAEGGRFQAVLMMDRTRFDHLTQRSYRSHAFVTIAAGLVFLAVASAWRASERLIEAQGRARVLETEARHLRELSQAAAGLAHETRNPLSLIRGWAQRLAQEGMDEDERGRHAGTLIEECDRMAARINQFLAFARPCEPERCHLDVADLVLEIAEILQPDLESNELEFRYEIEASTVTILADRELLRQALFNLIQNAIYFSPKGGVVIVALRGDGERLTTICVMDNGPGVPDDSINSLFTPYFTTRTEGTGLGLAIVKRIAAAHGWSVVYDTRPRGGAAFSIEGIHD